MKRKGNSQTPKDDGEEERYSASPFFYGRFHAGTLREGGLGFRKKRKLLEALCLGVLLLLEMITPQNLFEIEIEVAGIDPEEARNEIRPGEKIKIVFFQGPEERKANSGGLGELLPGNVPRFPFIL